MTSSCFCGIHFIDIFWQVISIFINTYLLHHDTVMWQSDRHGPDAILLVSNTMSPNNVPLKPLKPPHAPWWSPGNADIADTDITPCLTWEAWVVIRTERSPGRANIKYIRVHPPSGAAETRGERGASSLKEDSSVGYQQHQVLVNCYACMTMEYWPGRLWLHENTRPCTHLLYDKIPWVWGKVKCGWGRLECS